MSVASEEESNVGTENRKPRASTILLLCASVAVALLFGEKAVRWAVPNGYYIWPPGLKKVFMPRADIMPGISEPSHFVANSLGIRGDEFKSSNTYRILAIGGSTTECLYLDQSEAWPLLLQKYLNETAMYHNVWVGNAGMSGKTSRHHITAMTYLPLIDMQIDMIILLIGVNDLIIRLAQHEQYDPNFAMKPGSGQILVDETFYGGAPYRDAPFFKNTALWQIAHKAKGMIADRIRRDNFAENSIQDELGKMYVRLRQHRQGAREIRDELPDLSSAIEEYRRNVHTMIDIAIAKSIRLVFMTQPTMWKADLPDHLERLLWLGGIGDFMKRANRPYYSAQALDKGMKTYNEALLKVCEERRVECLDLASILEKDVTVFYDDVHFNEGGAQKVANALTKYIVNRELVMQQGSYAAVGRLKPRPNAKRDSVSLQ
jgi:lysophospholipase L1-like esterase